MSEFLSAEALGIEQWVRDALVEVLKLFAAGKMIHADLQTTRFTPREGRDREFSHEFNMACGASAHPCGTVACIGGTAEMVAGVKIGTMDDTQTAELEELLFPSNLGNYARITPAQATRALRSYLTNGSANWAAAMEDAGK
jgi:hypothetical protein